MTTTTSYCMNCGTPTRPGAAYCRACGTAIQPDRARAPADTPGRWWRTIAGWRRNAGRLLLVALVVGALAVTANIVVRQRTHETPDRPVRDWFAALAARDTAAAARLRPGLDVLRGDILRDSAYTPPTDVQILRTAYAPSKDEQRRPNHTSAYVTVRYRIAGRWFEQAIQVNRTGTGTARPWVLGDGATGSLLVVAGALRHVRLGPATIATQMSADNAASDDAQPVPPGRWTIAAVTDDPLFTANPVAATIPGRMREQSPTVVAVSPTVKPAAVAAVDKLVRSRIDDCAARQSLSLVDCPFDRTGGPYTGAVYSARWTIRRYPAIALAAVDEPYPGGPIATLSTTTPGVARVAYAAYTTGGKTVTETQDFTVEGDVRIEAGSLVWTGGKSGRLI